MRYHVKGGIWKNTEDEILKAAVMKYGLNQWSRISSLLVRKSAKQCKERWYEWLDPQIKKTEWTKDEEEKLLHLAKMFPCQWRTIAPIVGRTAYQCLEHYEILLDRAQGREIDENDPRKLRPGEIDPNPETKPARPDPIDMEEDQKEMLNEARARLANTRGKKAKRKAREKQLEEARRLAALQKKRELKSAGIDVVLRLPRKKKKEMNYNLDVPFERKVPDGSFEPEETPVVNKFKGAISLQFLENKNRDEEEEKFRKIDEKRMKNLKQKNMPEAIERINKMNDPYNIIQRNKLVLPDPQITEREIEGIRRLTTGTSGDSLGNINNESSATKVLMGEYTTQRRMTPSSMLRTPKTEDHIMKEAKLAISLKETSTPLVGGEDANADLQNYINYKKTDARGEARFKTPAPLEIARTGRNGNKTNETSHTPLRDEMKINLNEEGSSWENSSVAFSSSNQTKQLRENTPSVKFYLQNLPKPQNKYEIDVDFSENQEILLKEKEVSEGGETNVKIPEDSEDRIKKLIQDRMAQDKIEFLNQTQVVQRNLPRPSQINSKYQSYTDLKMSVGADCLDHDLIQAEEYIKEEMLKLLENDSINFPIKGQKLNDVDVEMNLEEYTLEEKQFARDLINTQMQEYNDTITNTDKYVSVWKSVVNDIHYIPDVQMYFHVDDIEKSKAYDSYKEMFNIQKNILNREVNISKKLEEKASVLTGGYLKRLDMLNNKFNTLIESISESKIKNKIYAQMKEQETAAIVRRQTSIDQYIKMIKEKENQMQEVYLKYQDKISELENL